MRSAHCCLSPLQAPKGKIALKHGGPVLQPPHNREREALESIFLLEETG
jgi:hypothetical protein